MLQARVISAKTTNAAKDGKSTRCALEKYVANCVEETDSCFLGGSVDAGLARIKQFIQQVDTTPLDTGTDRTLHVGNAFYGIVLPLYNRKLWPVLSQALRAGFGGDGSVLLRLSDFYSSRNDRGGYDDNSAEAIYAINCLDDPYAIPASRVAANLPAFEKASPTFGAVFAWGLTTCGGVRARATEPVPTVRAQGAHRSWWSAPRGTRRRRTAGPCTSPGSWPRGSSSPARATATRATTSATPAWTVPSRATCSTAPSRDGLTC